MKQRIRIGILLLLLLLGMDACKKPGLTEEEHQKLLAEIGEKNRQYHEKRSRFLESNLYTEGMQYVMDTLEELVPDGEYQVSLEPGSYINATEEARRR